MAAPILSPESTFTLMDTGVPSLPPTLPELPKHELWLLGATEVEDQWSTYPGGKLRTHQTETIHLPYGRLHRRLHTAPANPDQPAAYTIVAKLGWTESIDTDLVKDMHSYLSDMNPEAEMCTDATYGIDGTGDHLSLKEKLRLTQDEMAKQDLSMMRLVHGKNPLVISVTSQSAAEWARIEALNDMAPEEEKLLIIGRHLYEPCLVPRERGGLRMMARFFAHMVSDYRRELFTRTSPAEIPGIIMDELSSSPRAKDIPAIIGQGIALLGATEMELITALAAKKPVKTQGTRDCLKCPEVDKLEGFILEDVLGKGHSMGMHALKRAVGMKKAFKRMNLPGRLA